MKKVAIYARVSTVDKGQDLDTQLLPLKEYVSNRGWQIHEIYTDQISGSKESRPALNQLMNDAHKRKFDCLLVFRFDRFARSTKHLINSLELFQSLNIDFISYNENIDTSTPAGKMMFTLISAFAEFERSIIVERVKAGLEKARIKGRKLGRPRVEVDVKQILNFREKGLSFRQIAEKLHIPRSTLQKYVPG
ncbi:MAG: recombinase family protein [Patescibacteria group bacterium]|nr:recombinase family protein [Patescibacteria group bacterium]